MIYILEKTDFNYIKTQTLHRIQTNPPERKTPSGGYLL